MQPMTAPLPAPGAVTASHACAGVVGAFWCAALAQVVAGDAGVESGLFLLALPDIVGLVRGAGVLRRRARPTLLVVSAVATAAVLVATAVTGLLAYQDSAFVAFAAGPLLLVPLPVVAAALAARGTPS